MVSLLVEVKRFFTISYFEYLRKEVGGGLRLLISQKNKLCWNIYQIKIKIKNTLELSWKYPFNPFTFKLLFVQNG